LGGEAPNIFDPLDGSEIGKRALSWVVLEQLCGVVMMPNDHVVKRFDYSLIDSLFDSSNGKAMV
jgi:hypothetical protein